MVTDANSPPPGSPDEPEASLPPRRYPYPPMTTPKTGWPAGPWLTEPDSHTWLNDATGLRCAAMRTPMGHLCGYVRVGADNPYFASRAAGNLQVHGGATYSTGDDRGGWWIGFDCAHSCDFSPGLITPEMLAHLRMNMPPDVFEWWCNVNSPSNYRALPYVINETNRLALALADAAAKAEKRRLRHAADLKLNLGPFKP